MGMSRYDEVPWWCQLLWPWFGLPWYEQVEDPEAYLAVYWCALHLSADELAALVAGVGPPGEGYPAKAGRLLAVRHQAQETSRHEQGPPTPGDGQQAERPTAAEDNRTIDFTDAEELWLAGILFAVVFIFPMIIASRFSARGSPSCSPPHD
jgi:hypothetical protein